MQTVRINLAHIHNLMLDAQCGYAFKPVMIKLQSFSNKLVYTKIFETKFKLTSCTLCAKNVSVYLEILNSTQIIATNVRKCAPPVQGCLSLP